jgi:hypothetical protein
MSENLKSMDMISLLLGNKCFKNVAVLAISRASCYIVVLTPSQKGTHPEQYHLCKHVVMCLIWHSDSECSNLYTSVMRFCMQVTEACSKQIISVQLKWNRTIKKGLKCPACSDATKQVQCFGFQHCHLFHSNNKN